MRYLVFSETEKQTYPICLLIPTIRKQDIQQAYLDPFPALNPDELVVIDLHQNPDKKKTPAAEIKAYIEEELVPTLTDAGVEHVLVADGDYFKALTKASKVEANLGYVMDSPYGPWKVSYVPNHRAIFYDPDKTKAKIALAIEAVIKDRLGDYQAPGASIIKFAAYPVDPQEIEDWLDHLIVQNLPLAADIEAFSLKHHSAGIGTITFCWSEHEGIAFPVDYLPIPGATEAPFGRQVKNERIRKALKGFFERFQNTITWHGASYDVYVLIYQLWMKDIIDTAGLLEGLEVMLRNWDDTKIITYLATNSCAGNHLGLKENAQEFSGNYALEEIKDITRHRLPDLLQYNLVDGLSTWFVKKKYWDRMVADEQLEIYQTLFKPAMWDIIQMQLTGMPVNMERAKEVSKELSDAEAFHRQQILASDLVQEFTQDYLNVEHARKRNAKLKVKQIAPGDEPQEFNPNSDLQMRALLFDFLELPVINLTDSKLPSTDGETIEALLNRVTDPKVKELLEAIQMFAIVGTLTSNFMPAILNAVEGPDGWHYLFGNFNLGGTLSGRLSSSGPNLQNLPSTGKGHKIKLVYAKMIKSCFQAPPGWLFLGIDFASLEDRISALTTKDPNKLKVYTDGYDGHSLRAFAYFRDKMPDIRQAEGRRTFKITQDGQTHYLLEGEQVALPGGRIATVESLFDSGQLRVAC